ncbi:MAG: CpsD/CapB family tyrosine-protein kinase [Armatimonadetes bacterium]|nr:CpsD/CapB family tyrosine-protein kinase [Armatimonadota bacterium]
MMPSSLTGNNPVEKESFAGIVAESHSAVPSPVAPSFGDAGVRDPFRRADLRSYAEQQTVTTIEVAHEAALPVRVEAVTAYPDTVQETLLGTQAATISETILLRYREAGGDVSRHTPAPRFGAAARRGTANTATVIGVTSAVPGEGKTTTALHIALALAHNSYRNVCLIDLGLGQDVLCHRLGIATPVHGAVDVLEWDGDSEPNFLPLPLLQCENLKNLYLLPSGKIPRRAEKTAHSPRMGDLFAIARAWADLIVVDLPSVASGNTFPIQNHLQGVVMVVRAGVTPKDVATDAIERVGRANVIGVVLNGQESPLPQWLSRGFDKRGWG